VIEPTVRQHADQYRDELSDLRGLARDMIIQAMKHPDANITDEFIDSCLEAAQYYMSRSKERLDADWKERGLLPPWWSGGKSETGGSGL
jgi:hypothetical protein